MKVQDLQNGGIILPTDDLQKLLDSFYEIAKTKVSSDRRLKLISEVENRFGTKIEVENI